MKKKYYAITGISEEDKREFDTQKGTKSAREYIHDLLFSKISQNE